MAFKEGDVVFLKSGGPVMTVARITDEGHVVCIWFGGIDDTKVAQEIFGAEVLDSAAEVSGDDELDVLVRDAEYYGRSNN